MLRIINETVHSHYFWSRVVTVYEQSNPPIVFFFYLNDASHWTIAFIFFLCVGKFISEKSVCVGG